MSIVLCLLIYTPAYATIPNGSVEHTVTIFPGNGKILKNKDETYANNHITLTSKDDFEEINSIEYSIVDGEKLTNMMDYSDCDGSIYTAPLNDKLFAKLNVNDSLLPKWREVSFVTSTRMAKHILSYAEGDGNLELTSRYTDTIEYYTYQNGRFLPVGVKQLIMFMPNEEEQMFSHFVDQDGNTFKIDEPITKDLTLTPVYTSEVTIDKMDMNGKQYHQVTYLPGEGRMEFVRFHLIDVGGGRSEWLYDGYNEIERYDDVVYDGNYVDTYGSRLIDPYLQFQDRDLFSAYNFLKKQKDDVLTAIDNNEWIQAYTELDEAIQEASEFTFSSPFYYQENTRPYSITFLAFLSNYTINSKTLTELLNETLMELYYVYMYATGEMGYYPEDLERNLNEYFAWDWYYKSSEVAETDPGFDARLEIGIRTFKDYCAEVLNKFESTANQFISLYTNPWISLYDGDRFRPSGIGCRSTRWDDIYSFYYENDNFDRAKLYDGTAPACKLVFIPPEGYEFDHLEDQYGNVFDTQTMTVTEDLVLTPIYRELHEYHLTFTKGEGDLTVLYRAYNEETNRTEDHSNPLDEFTIKLWRGEYSYEIEKLGETDVRTTTGDYTGMGLTLHGLTLEESLAARMYTDQLNAYGDDDHLVFIPPEDCVFDHFEDETGAVWEYGTPLTKDTTVTPIYKSTLVDTTIRVVTEDNSNEEFDITLLRSFKNNMEEVFDKGDYDGTLQEYLADKQSYHFDENDWIINEDGLITEYTGELIKMLGIPDSINGIKVKGVATDAFASLYDRYCESYTGPYQSEAMYDYYNSAVAVWIPKSVERFSEGIRNEKTLEQYKESLYNEIRANLASQGKTEEEQETILAYYEDVISLTIEESGTNNCTPLVYLPLAYAVVEEGNKNYVSRGGSLYDKDYKTLLFLSCAARLDAMSYYNNLTLENIGLEIPRKVESISAFAAFNAVYNEYGGFFPIYAYGNTNFENYISYLVMELNFPEENFIEELCMNKFGMTIKEIEDKINFFYDPPEDGEAGFNQVAQRAYEDALAAGLIDENGNPTGSTSEMVDFMIPYYTQWFDENPDYYFTSTALELSMIRDGIRDVESGEYLVSETEAFEWQKAYIEHYSNGAITLDQEMNLIPNFTPEEQEQIEAKLQIIADQNSLNLEETREGLMMAYSIASFILITNPENAEAAKGPFIELLHTIDPNITQSELDENMEFFNMLVQANTSFNGQINKYGKVSQTNPFKTSLNFYDSYTYTAYLTDIPDRYVTPNTVEIKPADEKYTGTIYLRLKRGNIEIETVDANNSSKHLEASYTIYDSNGNEVATITATGEMDAVGYGNLTYGTYTVVQTTVENGYLRNTDVKTASITEDGEIIRLTFSNHTTSGMYSVRIPKTIVLDGRSGNASCVVSVMGTIDSTRQITVTPEQATFSLEEQNAVVDKKSPVEATIESNKTKWLSDELSAASWSDTAWNISAPLTAGNWYGRANIIITIKEKD